MNDFWEPPSAPDWDEIAKQAKDQASKEFQRFHTDNELGITPTFGTLSTDWINARAKQILDLAKVEYVEQSRNLEQETYFDD